MKKTGLKYEDALLLFEQKKYKEAQEVLIKLNKESNTDMQTVYFLAVVSSKLGEYELAISLFENFVSQDKKHVEALYNIALCYQKINNNKKALEYYQKVAKLNPFLSEAQNNMAVIYREMDNIEEAEKCYRQALKSRPDNINARSNLASLTLNKYHSEEYNKAVKLFESKQYTAALDILLKLNQKDPDNIDILNSLGILYFNLGDFTSSIKQYERITGINPNNEIAVYSIGVCYQTIDNYEQAIIYYKRAIELNPRYSEALNNMGLLYSTLKNYEEAENCFYQVLKNDPNYYRAMTNLGSVKLVQDKFDEAVDYFNKAFDLIIKTDDPQSLSVAYGNLGFVKLRQKELEEAIKYFDKAIEVDPENLLGHYNKGETLLMQGKLLEGWKEYEWRTGRKDFGKRHFERPVPKNVDLNGKRILVYAEQGVGDALQFVRYLPLLKEKDCYIIFECDKALFGVLRNMKCIDELIERNPEKAPEITYDYDIPLLSLALFFDTDLSNIPAKVPYLSVDKECVQKWQNVIGNSPSFKVGIVWAGSPIHSNDRHRSCKLKQFAQLFSVDGTKFFSLQKGFPLIQAKDYQLIITNLDDYGIKSFADTAGAIENLDLVITVDTSVAHLAGAMGKPVWVLIPHLPDWRWMLDRNDSPWYPTMRLFRQPALGDWDTVFNELRRELILASKKQNQTGVDMANRFHDSFINFFEKISGETYPEVPSELHTNITHGAIDTLIKNFPLPKDAAILDVGCGQGPALDYLKKLGFSPVGVTLNEEDVSVCNSKGHKVYKMDQSMLDFSDNLFDLLWVRHCLEHSIAPYLTLHEFNRVLKPGGLIYIEVPLPDTDAHHETNPNHYSVLPKSMWASLIIRSGFEIAFEGFSDLVLPDNHKDTYWRFYCRKKTSEKVNKVIYLGLSQGENFGWGVCSKYLKQELSRKMEIVNLDENPELVKAGKVDGKVFHALINKDFSSLIPVRGKENYGYTFFEYELSDEAIKNASNYDLIIGGSNWNKEKLESYGIKNSAALVQGIDPKLFYPEEKIKNNNLFIIFSGGKFEIRKGQDLVLKAVKILQQKYDDIILINAWYNMWPDTVQSMSVSKYINFEYKGDTWKNFMINLCQINGIDGNKVFTLPITPNDKLREVYLNSDIGLFPNRCEGGTNLVLMEYMACGKPVIASYNSGHKDILNENNSLMLKTMHEFKMSTDDGKLLADWEEPDMDEIIAKIEYAYFHREEIKKIGNQAGEEMKKYTWENTTKDLLKLIYKT